jgi:hypothetical protein
MFYAMYPQGGIGFDACARHYTGSIIETKDRTGHCLTKYHEEADADFTERECLR